MSTIVGHAFAPGLSPATDLSILIEVYASENGNPAIAFVPGQKLELVGREKVLPDASGNWTFTPKANALILPVNNVYKATYLRSGYPNVTLFFQAPNDDLTYWVGDVLVDPPSSLPSGALAEHIASTTAHPAAHITFDPSNDDNLTATNVQEALDQVDALITTLLAGGGGGGGTLAGDVTGAAGANTVVKIQGHAVATTTPFPNSVLSWNATLNQYVPTAMVGGAARASQHIYVTDYGLGDGSTSNETAIDAAIAALDASFTADGLDHTDAPSDDFGYGPVLEFPAGVWTYNAPAHGSLLPILGVSANASIWCVGQGNGATTILCKGPLGQQATLSTVTRGANGGAHASANKFILTFTTPHTFQVLQIISLQIPDRGGITRTAHYSILDDGTHRGDGTASELTGNTQIMYMAGYPEVQSGTNVPANSGFTPSGGQLDDLKPPVNVNGVPQVVTAMEYAVEPLAVKNPHTIHFDKMLIQGPNTNQPTDGMGVRVACRCHIEPDCFISGFWFNMVVCANAHGMPLATGGTGSQNTDHSWIKTVNTSNAGYAHLAYIDNSGSAWCGTDGNRYGGAGGGRDNRVRSCNFGDAKHALCSVLLNDAGALQTWNCDDSNLKGLAYPIFAEGRDGVDPREPLGIDCIEFGVGLKIEGAGSFAFAYDCTRRRVAFKMVGFLRMEAGLSINGGDSGTPGGGGSQAFGTFPDYTWRPWQVTNVSLVKVGGMPTLTFTGDAGMFGVDGGNDIGTALAVGASYRESLDYSYLEDGVTTNGSTTFASATAGFISAEDVDLRIDSPMLFGGNDLHTTNGAATVSSPTGIFTSADKGVVINSSVFPGGSATINSVNNSTHVATMSKNANTTTTAGLWAVGSDTIASVTNSGHVVMTRPCQAGAGQHWKIKNDGTAAQSQTNIISITAGSNTNTGGSRVKSCDYSVAGKVTVTMEYPCYNGPDLPGPYTASVGELGFMRWGSVHASDLQLLFDTEALDRQVHAQHFLDVQTLTPNTFRLIQDNLGPATSKQTMSFRVGDTIVRDYTVMGNQDGHTNGTTTFTSATAKFTGFDVGKTITGTNIPANTTISQFLTRTSVILSNAATGTSTTGTWRIGPAANLDAMRVVVERGQNRMYLYRHSSADGNGILLGHAIENSTVMDNGHSVQCSVCSPQSMFLGAAMNASPAFGIPGVSNNTTSDWPTIGAVTQVAVGNTAARVFYDASVVLVAQAPSILTYGDDKAMFRAADTSLISAGKMFWDNGAAVPGTVKQWNGTDTGKRLIGQCIKSAPSSTPGPMVPAMVGVERWT